MFVSSKISNSVLTFLEMGNASTDSILGATDIPEEFLRDSSSWVEAAKMEAFLKLADAEFQSLMKSGAIFFSEEGSGVGLGLTEGRDFIQSVGHSSKELRAWGVLDGVLKMMEHSRDVYAQPDRFLSYFISPPPLLTEVQKENHSISFEIALCGREFPLITSYIKSALEALPVYLGQSLGQVTWEGRRIHISWFDQQDSLFKERDVGRKFTPELESEILHTAEKKQRELEDSRHHITELNQQIERLTKELSARPSPAASETQVSHRVIENHRTLEKLRHDVARLHDYFIRAQQLITLMVAQDRKTAQVREAMRRVDWEFVGQQFPLTISSLRDVLLQMESSLSLGGDTSQISSDQVVLENSGRVTTDLNDLIEEVVSSVKGSIPKDVQVDRHLFLDQSVPVDRTRVAGAIEALLKMSVQSVSGAGRVRVSARPNANWAEIEISDTGCGSDAVSAKDFEFVGNVVRDHRGRIHVTRNLGQGSTYLINLPV